MILYKLKSSLTQKILTQVLSLVVNWYFLVSKNTILIYTMISWSMSCVQHRNKGKKVNDAHDRYRGKVLSDQMTFLSLE
jgi:hypothetical protein